MKFKAIAALLGLVGMAVTAMPAHAAYVVASSGGFATSTAGASTFADFDSPIAAGATISGGISNGGANPGAGGNWLAASTPVTVTFTSMQDYFGLYWGTNDDVFNQLEFYNGTTLLGTVQGAGGPNAFWNITAGGPSDYFDSVRLTMGVLNGSCCFEFDNLAARGAFAVPEPHTTTIVGLGLVAMIGLRRRKKI